jgi:flagellar motor switch protein FliM
MKKFGKNVTESRARHTPELPPLARYKPKKIKEYNFKNPDKFSKEHLRILGSIHEMFCRQVNMALNAALRMSTELSVANVQQLTYGDYVASVPEDLLTGVLNMYPFVTQFCMGVERHLIGAMLDRLLGGMGVSNIREELTDVEISIIKDTLRRMLAYMPEGWQTLVPATDDVELIALEMSPVTAQIVPPTDIVALITINVEIGSYLGLITICIPYAALEEVINSLTRQSTYKNDKFAGEDTREFIISKLANTTLPVKIVLARGQLSFREATQLQVGDVVKLSTVPSEKAEIWIGEELKFLGRPGQIGKNFSVAISEEYSEDK